MSLGFTVQPCAYCNALTAIRYKTIYACLDHVGDAQRDDPQAHGRASSHEIVKRLGLTPPIPPPVVRQPSIKWPGTDASGFSRLMPKPEPVPEAPAGVEIEVDGRVLSAAEARDEFDDLDPLHLDGFDPKTKTFDTPSGKYEGPIMPAVVEGIDPDDW
jgi:hypothetical protein